MQKRGMLTERVQKSAKKLLHREIDKIELRLIPYVNHVLLNEQYIDVNKVNSEDLEILERWVDEGHMTMQASKIHVSRKFWHIMSTLLWLAYVDRSE